jgi:putative nucleotidyltransferase with HDIG domain
MPLVSRTLKLRLLYQIFEAPATAASDPRVASSVTKRARRVKADSFSRTDGMTSVSPIRGNLKRVSSPVQEWVRRRLDHYRDTLLYAYTAVLALLAASLIAGMVWSGVDTGPPYGVVVLAVLALLAERQSIRLAPSIEVSTASLILVFAAVAFGPLAAIMVGVTGLLVDLRRPFLRWALWTASRAVLAGLVGLTALAFSAQTTHDLGVLVVAVCAAAVVEALADLALGAVTQMIRKGGSVREVFRTIGPLLVVTVPLHTSLVVVLAYVYREVSPWSVLLFLLPAFAAQRLFLLYRQQRETSEQLAAVNEQLEKANLSFATALVATLDARDRYTAGHSAAVAVYARDIAARMGLPEDQQRLVHLCGLVHDIGKIGLPPGLLEKPGALTLDERRQMEEHSVIGERILAQVDDYSEIAKIVRHHHERMDGHGYPDGLVGTDIPLLSRLIAVADAYDAMTSDRPYRDAMPSQVARMRLAQAVETQFDTTVVAAFEAILATADDAYRSGTRGRFIDEVAVSIAPEERIAASVA